MPFKMFFVCFIFQLNSWFILQSNHDWTGDWYITSIKYRSSEIWSPKKIAPAHSVNKIICSNKITKHKKIKQKFADEMRIAFQITIDACFKRNMKVKPQKCHLSCGVSKFSQVFYILKGDQTNFIAWNFQWILFT